MDAEERRKVQEDIYTQLKHAEVQYVTSLYINPELMYDYAIPPSSFSRNSDFGLYYAIAYEMVMKNKYESLDNLSVDTFVQKQSDHLKKRYRKLGGYEPIDTSMDIIDEANIYSYYESVLKYHTIVKLSRRGWDIVAMWDKVKNYNLEQLQNFVEVQVNESFIDNNFSAEEQVVSLVDGLDEMVAEADRGELMGLPYNSKLVNSFLNGMKLGEVTFLTAMSGVGKTYLMTLLTIVGLISKSEPVLIIANEEGATKFKRELLTYICNNQIALEDERFKGVYIEKNRFFVGGFTKKEKELLTLGIQWMEENIPKDALNFIELNSFSTEKTIKIIKRYALTQGIKYFIIDTFKHDNDLASGSSDNSWLDLQQSSVKLYNTIKESNLNVYLMMTYQLSKSKRKYLDQTALGNAKNVIDIASTLILVRPMMVSEKNSIEVWNENGKMVEIDKDADYMILFFDKNRAGSVSRQVVLKVDYARNMFKDVGTTQVAEDF